MNPEPITSTAQSGAQPCPERSSAGNPWGEKTGEGAASALESLRELERSRVPVGTTDEQGGTQ